MRWRKYFPLSESFILEIEYRSSKVPETLLSLKCVT